MSELKGCIIEESLKDPRIVNGFKVTKVRITSVWHVYTVLVDKKQIETIAKNLKEGTWYAHFWDEQGNMTAVFSGGKTFNFNYHDKSTWKAAVDHGLELGIPQNQLHFLFE